MKKQIVMLNLSLDNLFNNHLAYIVTICTFSCFYTYFIFVHHLARPYTHFTNNICLQGPGLESLSPSSQITTNMSDPHPVKAICADSGSCLETRRKRRQNVAVLQIRPHKKPTYRHTRPNMFPPAQCPEAPITRL